MNCDVGTVPLPDTVVHPPAFRGVFRAFILALILVDSESFTAQVALAKICVFGFKQTQYIQQIWR